MVYNYNERTAKNPAVKTTIEHIATKIEALLSQLKLVITHNKKKAGGGKQKPDITNPEVPGTGDGGDEPGDGGDEGDGTQTPDITNPDITNPENPHNPDITNPDIPDFE